MLDPHESARAGDGQATASIKKIRAIAVNFLYVFFIREN